VSNRGRQWNSEFFKKVCDLLNVQLRLSTSAHPQTNGLTERTNTEVEIGLRLFTSATCDDWDLQLPALEFALNNTYRDSIQCTPFELNRISQPLSPSDHAFALTQNKTE
jgi:transposase InsO family protein